MSAEQSSLLVTAVSITVGVLIAGAGSDQGKDVGPLPVFVICAMLAFAINWVAFVPAYVSRTERYFDLTGSLTYLTVVGAALMLSGAPDPRALLLGALVAIWAVRLGMFLFSRIVREGRDARFDEIKGSFARFLMTWTMQGLWVLLTVSCALAAMTATGSESLGLFAVVGTALWMLGFTLEVVADMQKTRFRANPENADDFIRDGVWAWSRHPNYFGEIMLWTGVAVVALPVLTGWQYVTLVSPVFVYVLLTRISGIPILEERAQQRWGEEPAYQAYKARTSLLIPRPPTSL